MLSLCLAHALAGEGTGFDHADLDALLGSHVSAAGVDYAGLAASSGGLDAYVTRLAGADVAALGQADAMAFWINAYNALTLQLVVANQPLASIRDLDDGNPWDARTWTVAGSTVTLNAIEHEILRPMGDARIHAAVNCASKGCPPLATDAFTGPTLDAQLTAASRAWSRENAVTITEDSVALSAIFDWFGDDFVGSWGPAHHDIPGVEGKQEAALNFVAQYLDDEQRVWLHAGGYTVTYAEYDWSLNAR